MPTRALAEYVVDFDKASVQGELLDKAKNHALDFFRLCIIGSTMPWAKSVYQVTNQLGGKGTSTVLRHGERTSPTMAAFANGNFAHATDWDDTHIGSYLHPGVVVFPAALAAAEAVGADGLDFLAAAIVGYEVTIRIGEAVQPSHFHRGFHGTATCGTFGAAAAAGKLFGLNADQLDSALSLAASHASGLGQFFRWGSTVKRIHAGKSALAGVMSALLVKEGITGPPYILEGDMGFCRAYSDEYRLEKLTEGLGGTPKIMEVSFKTHAGGGHFHAAMDAAVALNRQVRVPIENIENVTIGCNKAFTELAANPEPKDLQSAQMSIIFSVATALWKGLQPEDQGIFLTLDDYHYALESPEIRNLALRTTCLVDSEVEARETDDVLPARVRIRTKDGQEFERWVDYPIGSPRNPLSLKDQADRTRLHTASVFPADRLETLIEKVLHLEQVQDVRDVTPWACVASN